MNRLRTKKGFTLIEMVVSMSIFMIFLTVVLNSYISLTTTQNKANKNREAVAEAKEIFNFISEEAREKAIDYTCFQDTICGTKEDTLSLISKDGLNRTIIRKQCISEEKNCTIYSKTQNRENALSAWISSEESPLHSANLKIQSVAFFVIPNLDPFNFGNLETQTDIYGKGVYQFQPVFHIILNIKRKEAEGLDDNPIIIQTSISSRIYK